MHLMDLAGRRPLVSWLIVNSLIATGAFWLWMNGIAADAIANDKFYVVSTIGVWYLLASYTAGMLAYNIEKMSDGWNMNWKLIRVKRLQLSFVWFSSSTLLNLGLAGTTYGFIAMLVTAFYGKDFSNVAILSSLIPVVGENWAAALYATAAGITGMILLSIQAYIIDYALDLRTDVSELKQ